MNIQLIYKEKKASIKLNEPLLADLCAHIKSAFKLDNLTYTLSYMDHENDLISIRDDDDLLVCIYEFNQNSVVDESIKIAINDLSDNKSTSSKDSDFVKISNFPEPNQSMKSSQSFSLPA